VNSEFWTLLKSVNESPDLLGYVQINDIESYSQDDVDASGQGGRLRPIGS